MSENETESGVHAIEVTEIEETCEAHIGLEEDELYQVRTRALFTQLPMSGSGFYSYATFRNKQFGRPETIRAIEAISAAWQAAHPKGPRIGIGNISLQGGGPMPPHSSHHNGLDVDIRLVTNNGKEIGLTYKSAEYSRTLTQELVNLIRANSVLKVKIILFNDPNVSGVMFWKGHDDHLHVAFRPPGSGSTHGFSTDKGQTLRLVAPYMRGESVRQLQEALVKAGISVTVDSVFGRGTQNAVMEFQRREGLTVDGIVGPATRGKLGLSAEDANKTT